MTKEQIIAEKKEESQWICKHGNTPGMDWCDRDTCKGCNEAIKKECVDND